MPVVTFSPGEEYTGEGISEGLPRGLLVFLDGTNITGEGMGIGAVAVKDPGFSYFATGCTTEIIRPDIVEKTFLVDRRLLWGRGNSSSVRLTWLVERILDAY